MKMKKIIILILLIISTVINVNAIQINDNIYSAGWISDIYFIKYNGKIKYYKQARFIRRKSDDRVVYCIEPFKDLEENSYYTGYTSDYENKLGLTKNKWENIKLISYYGYGYKNHTASKWYVVTQIMIWRVTNPTDDFYFTDTLNGNEISSYNDEINEINSLVNKHNKIPSMASKEQQFSINSTNELIDTNGVLSEYTIQNNGQMQIEKNSNKLKIITKEKEENIVIIKRNFSLYNNVPIAMLYNSSQKLLLPGNPSTISKTLKINSVAGKISIKKSDYDTNSIEPSGEGILIGSKYGLYDQKNNLVEELIISDKNIAVSKDLEYGKYTIKEIESNKGYLLDENEYIVEINSDNLNIRLDLKNKAIKEKIIINKYIEEGMPEENIKFRIYNNKNELVREVTTNDDGKIEVELYYGTYILKQISTTPNYLKSNDITISIDNDPTNNEYRIYNKRFSSKIRIINKDKLTNERINNEAIFKIFNIDENKYVTNEMFIVNGELVSLNFFKAGNYYLEEVEEPNEYLKIKEKILFTIDENNEFDVNENNELIYNIIVYYEKKPNMVVVVPDTNQNKSINSYVVLFQIVLLGLISVKLKKI